MKKDFSLQPVREHAQRQTDNAAVALGRLRNQEQKTRQTLETLRNYRDEYRTRFEQALKDGISPGELNNYQAFLAKLDRAVDEQTELVEQSQVRSEHGLKDWQAQSHKVKTFDTLAARELEKQREAATRQEQRNLDEHTNTNAFKHRG